jgi:hypothetical protein
MITAEILVFDRDLPDQLFVLRRQATRAHGPGFSKWLAKLDLGRFLVVIDGAEQPYVNIADEAELVSVIGLQYLELMRRARENGGDGRLDFHIHAGVTPEIEAKLSQLWELTQKKFAAGGGSTD